MDKWSQKSEQEVLTALKADRKQGLTQVEAQKRLDIYGYNELKQEEGRSLITVFFSQFKNPLIYILMGSAVITYLVGKPSDPLVVMGVVCINALMGAIQEGRAERTLKALKKLTQFKCRVLRDGVEVEVPSNEITLGDILILSAGDAVGADARLLEAIELSVNESSLTGESTAVSKEAVVQEKEVSFLEENNMVFAGTFVTAGKGKAVVTGISSDTQVGKIAHMTQHTEHRKTPLEYRIDSLCKHLSYKAFFLCLLLVGLGIWHGLPLQAVLMTATAQLVSIIPEGLPVAITIALAVGVQRMVRKGTIVRKLVAVETLGSTNFICTDKTGTLTKNEMTVERIVLPSKEEFKVTGKGYSPHGDIADSQGRRLEALPKGIHFLIECGLLCNDARYSLSSSEVYSVIGDPTEIALKVCAVKAGVNAQLIEEGCVRTLEKPFNSDDKYMGVVCQQKMGKIAFFKGALEKILGHSRKAYIQEKERFLDLEERNSILSHGEQLASEGYRLIALSYTPVSSEETMENYLDESVFLGFVAIKDPLREEAKEAIALCEQAGITPVMITGDHLHTASAIGKEIGILNEGELALEGKDLDALSEEELESKIEKIAVLARVRPDQKLRIVQALQRKGHIVAMTGDGVNDAPSLAQADVGVAMGKTGTEVAKEAAKIIITDDNFTTIVEAVHQGRVIYNNLKKVVFYLLSTSLPAAFLLLLAILFDGPLPLAAVQILWINVVTEGAVTINLVMDPPEGDEMRKRPFSVLDQIISKGDVKRMIGISFSILVCLGGLYLYGIEKGYSDIELKTKLFTLLAICAWINVMNCRSNVKSVFSFRIRDNYYLVIGLMLGIGLQLSVLYIPFLNELFYTYPLSIKEWVPLIGIGLIPLIYEEIRKYFVRKRL